MRKSRKSIGGAARALMALLAAVPMAMIGAAPAQAEESPYQPDVTSPTSIGVWHNQPALTEKGAYRLEAIPLAGYASASETMTCLTPYPGWKDTPCTDDTPQNLRKYEVTDVRMRPIADSSAIVNAMPAGLKAKADPGNPFQSVADAQGDISDDMQDFAKSLAASDMLPAPAQTFSTGDGDGFANLAPGAYLIRTAADSPHQSKPAIIFTQIAPNTPADQSWTGAWRKGDISYHVDNPSDSDLMDKPIATVDAKPATGASIGDMVRVTVSQTLHSSDLNGGELDAALPKGLTYAGNDAVAIDDAPLKALDAQPNDNGDLPKGTANGDCITGHDDSGMVGVEFGQVLNAGSASPTWDADYGLHLPDSDRPIVVSYSFDASLNKDAVIGRDGNPVAPAGIFRYAGVVANSLPLDLFAEPRENEQDDGLMHGDPAIVYTGALDLKKTDLGGKALNGAQFALARKGQDAPLAFSVDGTRLIPDAKGDAALNANAAHIEGLDGDFVLRETKAPDGYQPDGRLFNVSVHTDADGIHVTADKSDRLGAHGTAVTLADAKTPASTQPKPEQPAKAEPVASRPEPKLAQTGAGSVMPLLTIGLLLTCAGASIPLARRMK
jgi:hypothetical protein